MKVTMSADLGIWVKPTRETGGRGHQGPWRRAGLSYQRRLEKRAAERAAVATAEQAAAFAEQDAAIAKQAAAPVAQAADATAGQAAKVEAQFPTTSPSAYPAPAARTTLPGKKQQVYTCSKCGQPCHGNVGQTGVKCSNAPPLSCTPP